MRSLEIRNTAQARVQALLDRLTGSGAERGLQVAAYLDGELVIDAASGVADPASERAVTGDTLFTAFSASKGITATAIHLLVEAGGLSYDDRIARFWPQFAANGKGDVTLRQVLAHSAGIPQMPGWITPETMGDWDRICEAIASSPPLWAPGTQSGYHAMTFGWILGEVLRRVDGRPIARFVHDEIARPLGVERLYFGVPADREGDLAVLESGPIRKKAMSVDALILKAIPIAVTPSPKVYNRPEVRRASIPAAGGVMTARVLARLYASLIGEVDGVRLFTSERLKAATALQFDTPDPVLDERIPKALGYFLGTEGSPMGDRPSAFGHPGAGGSIGFADPEKGFAFALLKNRLVWESHTSPQTALQVAREARSALGIEG
ncbi:MAG TPA: serine hydrolase domain-containing protein [Pantanalinema sp.]